MTTTGNAKELARLTRNRDRIAAQLWTTSNRHTNTGAENIARDKAAKALQNQLDFIEQTIAKMS